MILSLTLKCFRKHADTHIDFTQGLNVLRGANEAGKSTVIEGMLYALYGSKALRNTLAETATWGQKDSALKAELVLRVGGREYTFNRSKGGAECVYSDGNGGLLKIVGHTEVSTFAGELLGADAKTASLLMLSSQSGLRGALDDGPAAVSGLMSKLADFDLIDTIIENAQASLLLGSTTPFEAKLGEAEQAIRDLEPVDEAPVIALNQALNGAKAGLGIARECFAKCEPDFKAAEADLVSASNHNEKYRVIKEQIAGLDADLEKVKADKADAEARAAKRADPLQISGLQHTLEDASKFDHLLKIYQSVMTQPPYPAVSWDEARATLDSAIQVLRAEEQGCLGAMSAAQQLIASLKKQFITSGPCPTCGHDSGKDDHVRLHNDGITEQIRIQEAAWNTASMKKASIGHDINAHVAIVRAAEPFDRLALSLRNQELPVSIDETCVPPIIKWFGPKPVKPDVSLVQRQLAELQAYDRLAIQAEGQAQAYDARRKAIKDQLDALHATLRSVVPPFDLAPLQQRYNQLMQEYLEHKAGIERFDLEVKETQERYRDAKNRLDLYRDRLVGLNARVADIKADLVKLDFNNTLVKKLRGLKPAITDHLWNTVLSAVSNFFSSLRGEESVVSKEAAGFRVNGQSIESLSGSTIDVLALAVRVALTKTFIPHASFMVLDEPAHGCDNDRTSNVLGFLSSVGFAQTLLASHDELSESVADNVINLGV